MIQPEDTLSDRLHHLARRAMEDGLLNLTADERRDIAAELYRLADAVTLQPVTQGDIEAQGQALRRVAWLTGWLERARQQSAQQPAQQRAKAAP